MVSFDVVSLFTNVPTDPAIQVAKRRLEADDGLKERTELTTEEVLCGCHILYLSKGCLQEEIWNSNRIPCVSYGGESSNGRH